ncbi:hypothetical protein SAMN04489761_2865 [Tenacibaculum sp. MAR_2009_124]|uniref:hypothetical protein n=1 Tax=Tenacibaculum sp. MAR_2009_124 TaxID=1250059 RepID=UPI00089AE376|nr:hypothetical protein [Tenacibaculum sp. MAR_2009_124]SEC39183.1 hypothetical protein SAMN04489761_2865 [Tenacibaculum sp. MAR_2009_124]
MNLFKDKMDKQSPGMFIGKIVFITIAVAGLAILFGYLIMWLWNALMPDIFGLPAVNYWQGVGLFVLAKIIFGFGGGDCGGNKRSKHSSKKRRKHKFKSYYEKNCKGNFSEWEHYNEFWEEEGNKAYKNYLNRRNVEKQDDDKENN